MKKTIIAVVAIVVLGVIGGGIYWMEHGNKITVQGIQKEIVEKVVKEEVVFSELQKRIESAQNASTTEIEAEAQKAYTDKKTQMLKEIELDVRTAYENELKTERVKLEKEVGTY